MNRLFWQAVKVAPVLLAACLFTGNKVNAQTISAEKEGVNQTLEKINNYQNLEQGGLSQVTNVNQLRDVSPTDWAYEALRSLVDRYGCIAGFPNQTYRGNQPLTRYEFAAGLNSCLNQIERLIASQESVSQEDLDTIARLSQEFEAELATLGGRVDELESRTAVLEDSQFSITTKLGGEAIFGIADAFGGGTEDTEVGGVTIPGEDDFDAETTFSSRVRLSFDTSFTGQDLLKTRIQAANIPNYGDVTGTDSSRLAFDTNTDNNIELDKLYYRFPVGERITAWVGTNGLDLDDIFNPGNPTLASSSSGALSRFNRYNPLIFRSTQGAGAGVSFDIVPDRVAVTGLYLTDDGASSPAVEEGLFNGSFSGGAQLEFTPFEALGLTATYVRNYQTADSVDQSGSTVGGVTGGFATQPFGETDTTADKFGLGANFDVGERFVIGAFGGYSKVKGLIPGDDNDLSGEIWTWGANVSILDLVKEGSQLSVAGGMVPRFGIDNAASAAAVAAGTIPGGDPDTSYLVEAQYKFPVNENIEITPGAFAVFNPNHVSGNDTVYTGVLRTTFKF
ncbi:MAG: iron uptake porin [Pleurocapsa sp.]